MRKNQRVQFIREVLTKYFPNPDIPLKHTCPYTLLVAVLLSAQCTDIRVNLITPLLFSKAKTPFEMVELSVEEIEKVIRPCGLSNTKAKAIWALSEKLIKENEGEVPKSLMELESLPGVGHKTASVVISQAFGIPAFPVDTHIHRCAKRWKLSKGENVIKTERDLKRLFPREEWHTLHLQIIFFARGFCPARGHNPDLCPICSAI